MKTYLILYMIKYNNIIPNLLPILGILLTISACYMCTLSTLNSKKKNPGIFSSVHGSLL